MATSPKRNHDRVASEDPDTAATRKELRQTAISEKPDPPAMADPTSDDAASSKNPSSDENENEPHDSSTREQMPSPKRKRAHAEVDEPVESIFGADPEKVVSGNNDNGSTSASRTNRDEPEKKRPRDLSSGPGRDTPEAQEPKNASEPSGEKTAQPVATQDAKPTGKENTTSVSAFKSSSMASFATQESPFQAAVSGQPLSIFFNPSGSTPSPFGTTPSPFGTNPLSNNSAISPFGTASGTPLTTFGKPSGTPSIFSQKGTKPVRFGAPEGDSGASVSDSPGGGNGPDDGNEGEVPTPPRLQQVTVDNGEAGETPLIQFRAKLYIIDKTSNSWKERGVGTFKINVPTECVDIDGATGLAIPGSFDSSGLEQAESKNIRLLMRQDSTHRIILNTAINPAMQFKEKSSLKANYILFTAIEDGGPISMQIKVNAASAKKFMNEIEKLQRELELHEQAQSELRKTA